MVSSVLADVAVVPGATITLISESRGTRIAVTTTSAAGSFVFVSVPPDRYSLEVTKSSFRSLVRGGIAVSSADQIGTGPLMLAVGGVTDVASASATPTDLQSQSGDRAFTVSSEAVANLPIANRNFANLVSLAPGLAGTNRLGGGGQNNLIMDGVAAMDTGSNSQMLPLNVESIAEVKVFVSTYGAELGRSSGLQVVAVTKAGTNHFHGAIYDIQRDSDWNESSWANAHNGDPKPVTKEKDFGYSIGGPIGPPGGMSKWFFFYSHEYRPRTTAGATNTFRVPTALERAGDFSETLDNSGARFNLIRDTSTGLPCSAANITGCFQDGGVLGRISKSRLYQPGLRVLNIYPLPNMAQGAGDGANFKTVAPAVSNLTQQPVVRFDYQSTSLLRLTARYAGQRARRLTAPGSMPGFNDTYNPKPFITTASATANYAWTPTTFLEVTYGFARNYVGSLLTAAASDRLTDGLSEFPLLYPDAGLLDPDSYQYRLLAAGNYPFFDSTTGRVNLPPVVAWGNRISPAPPSLAYPAALGTNRTQDIAASITKIAGRHTVKGGFYNNHSYKAQNVGQIGAAPFQAALNFGNNAGNDTMNLLDSGFGFANAALGVFSSYGQASRLMEASLVYNNTELYLQDNWRAGVHLTLDYGLRLTHQQPQYDTFLQSSNFFQERWSLAAAPALYVAGCPGGTLSCAVFSAMDPRTGTLLVVPGGASSQLAIGTIVPNSGDLANGLVQAGNGISKYGYTWPALVFAPRFGAAYTVGSSQTIVVRGGAGVFYDRPDGNSVIGMPANPPNAESKTVQYGQLQDVGASGLTTIPTPTLTVFQYDAKIPSSVQWNAGIQAALPWASAIDVAYVGQHGFNMPQAQQGAGGANAIDLNGADFGTAFLPQYRDPTAQSKGVPGDTAFRNPAFLRPFRGYGAISTQLTRFSQTFHSIQTSFNRRFRHGVKVGVNYTLSLQFVGNTGLGLRLQHSPEGTYSVRDDQAAFEALNRNLNLQRHIVKASAFWTLPTIAQSKNPIVRVIAAAANDWQLSGVLTAGSANKYDLSYSYNGDGTNQNLTGSFVTTFAYQPKVVYVADPGKGCSSDQYRQFNVAAVAGPTYNSVALESGRNHLTGCSDRAVDVSLARNIHVGGGRQLQIRVDAFNAFNAVVYNARVTQMMLTNPTAQGVTNAALLADGSVNPNRVTPRSAGFGAANGAQALRSLQLQVRFAF
ncbi:MAG: carboxypeptidase-like regulatory domain-containing protein [Acidobacteriota bacterium]